MRFATAGPQVSNSALLLFLLLLLPRLLFLLLVLPRLLFLLLLLPRLLFLLLLLPRLLFLLLVLPRLLFLRILLPRLLFLLLLLSRLLSLLLFLLLFLLLLLAGEALLTSRLPSAIHRVPSLIRTVFNESPPPRYLAHRPAGARVRPLGAKCRVCER